MADAVCSGIGIFNAMIRFDRVSYAYSGDNSHPVLQDISLTIDSGEELAVMGANGCGKTTLGLMLCGILKPDTGKVIVDDRDDENAVIGFLFQDPDNGLVATTVEREIAFSLENKNMPPEAMQPIVDRIMRLFDMHRFKERLVWNLSGGEKQRLSLAGLLAASPAILFLDEPASYLDYPGSKLLARALDQVKEIEPQLTVIRVTQYPQIAEEFSRVIVMDAGRIVMDDTPENIFSERDILTKTGIRPPLKYLTPVSDIKIRERDNTDDAFEHPVHVELDHLSFDYDEKTPVFDDLCLKIRRGGIIGLVGPSGCGKSTLAQIICGIYKPSSGAVKFAGTERRAVMSFQQPERQFFLDTCYDEISYGVRNNIKSSTSSTETVRKCMEMVGLDYATFANRNPHNLSGGEARRLGFAIVVALDADLIIFDEPTCGLDEHGLRAFKNMLIQLKADGKTIMLISHNSEIIADTCDRVALLDDGKIVMSASPLLFFSSDRYKEILAVPEVISYQRMHYRNVFTTHPGAIFDLENF